MWIENKTWLLHKANVNLNNRYNKGETLIGSLVKRKHISINTESTLRKAIENMAAENIDVLPVLSKENGHVIGILSYKNIISSYKHGIDEHTKKRPDISLKEEA